MPSTQMTRPVDEVNNLARMDPAPLQSHLGFSLSMRLCFGAVPPVFALFTRRQLQWLLAPEQHQKQLKSAATTEEECIEQEYGSSSKHLSPSLSFSQYVQSFPRLLRRQLQALGWQPVSHSIFHAPSSESAARSGKRLFYSCASTIVYLSFLTLITTRGYRKLTQQAIVPMSLLPTHSKIGSGLHELLLSFTSPVSSSSTSSSALSSFFSHEWLRKACVLAIVPVVTSLTIGATTSLLSTLGIIERTHEGYSDISRSMLQPFLRSRTPSELKRAREQREKRQRNIAADEPDAEDGVALWRRFAEAQQGMILFVGALIEEFTFPRLSSFLQTLTSRLAPSRIQALTSGLWHTVEADMIVEGTLSALIHTFASGQDGNVSENALGAFMLSSTNALLRRISPLLPYLNHVLLNYMALDAFAAISPLASGRVVFHANGEVEEQSSPTSALHAFNEELYYFFHPAHQSVKLRWVETMRGIPLLCFLQRGYTHPMFETGHQLRHHHSSWFARIWHSTCAQLLPIGLPSRLNTSLTSSRGVRTLSKPYQKVLLHLFQLLDPHSKGYISAESFAFLFFLVPAHLELARAAFIVLDEEFAHANLERMRITIEEMRINLEKERLSSSSPKQTYQQMWEEEKRFKILYDEAARASIRLEGFFKPERREPEENSNAATKNNKSNKSNNKRTDFPCREWLDIEVAVDESAASSASSSSSSTSSNTTSAEQLRSRRQHALEVLRQSLSQGGFQSSSSSSSRLAWNMDSPSEILTRTQMEDFDALCFQKVYRPRLKMLLKHFAMYVHSMAHMAFEAHVNQYGNLMQEEVANDDVEEVIISSTQQTESSSSSSSSSSYSASYRVRPKIRFVRRLTYASFVDLITDRALLDARETDALLTQCVMVLEGAMHHPLHMFNLTLATFDSE